MDDLAPHELRILVAVERERGFTAAAASLGLTQSAVSHAVRACERKLGVVLFHRGRYGARPTAAGTRTVAYARRILRLMRSMRDEARDAGDEAVTGPLRIAAFRSVAAHLLPRALERLTGRHPGLAPRVSIVREIGRGTAGLVADGHADLGLATLDGAGPPKGLLSGKLFDEPYVLAHPRAGTQDPRTLPLIDWDENCGSYTRDWWARQDWIPPATILAEDDTVVLSMVSQGMGMSLMPALALTGAPADIALTGLGPRPPTRGVGYVTTSELAGTAAVRELIRELRSAAASLTMPVPASDAGSPAAAGTATAHRRTAERRPGTHRSTPARSPARPPRP
ncbi:LysR family transcriptional regulator [Streptomyces albus subsp. chlorinus]|uniref:LysR family transcriptional regulator n=1 Tax=Streptomyces albus TaxID=1888 RepID=UPI00156E53B5|nr:LysR family transcriptional regulator [Streptomyces albus]NSC23433.1 LysR family transcriptional regulator [Streptomyces albus subsp. chlorinus]